jgi:hypothetical protein
MAPLGPNVGPEAASFRIAAHQAHGDVKNSWISWIIRGIIREAGLMNASMDQQYLLAYKDFLDNDGIEDQLTFHKNA